jgi:hypothetical protein
MTQLGIASPRLLLYNLIHSPIVSEPVEAIGRHFHWSCRVSPRCARRHNGATSSKIEWSPVVDEGNRNRS